GFFTCPDPACDEGGGTNGFPGIPLYQWAEAQEGADIHLTVDGEEFVQHDDAGIYPGNSLETRLSGGGLFCLNLSNNRAPEGYALENTGGTFNLFQGNSSSMDPATVVADNGNLGGDIPDAGEDG